MSDETNSLVLWREKLEHLQQQEAIAADAEQKFSLHKKIQEAKEKITELSEHGPLPDRRVPSDSAPAAASRERTLKLQAGSSRLPTTGSNHLFGRDEALEALTQAWTNSQTHIVQIVGGPGVGKTQLVKKWREDFVRQNKHEDVRVEDWSFYSQGSRRDTASADPFFNELLRTFGEQNPKEIRDRWRKGTRLAELVRETRTLLILDGLEPLQHPPVEKEGELTDLALKALFRGLTDHNAGLCIVTTRIKVPELCEIDEPAHVPKGLFGLEPADGAKLLNAYEVLGSPEELKKASEDYKGNPLALTLLGTYLRDRFGGDIRAREPVDSATGEERGAAMDTAELLEGDAKVAQHARNVIKWYVNWFEADKGADEVSKAAVVILRLMGLFNRPADCGCLDALRAKPAISALTTPLFKSANRHELWRKGVPRLRNAQLLTEPNPDAPDTLDAHPVVRAYFADELSKHRRGALQEAHFRLYEYLKSVPKHKPPNNLTDMMPLYHAVAHACKAGRYSQAWEDVYKPWISQGMNFSVHELGACGEEVAVLSSFFEERWTHVVEDDELHEEGKADILGRAGFSLRLLGRTNDAVEATKTALMTQMGVVQSRPSLGSYDAAARHAGSLSVHHLDAGDLSESIACAELAVYLSSFSENKAREIKALTQLAQAIHYAGKLEAAKALLVRSEQIQAESFEERKLLYGTEGFRYCELILALAEYDDVCDRISLVQDWSPPREYGRLTKALNALVLGRAYLMKAKAEGSEGFGNAEEELNSALELLPGASHTDNMIRGLVAQAELYRAMGRTDDAQRVAREADFMAKRASMLTFEIDAKIELCHVCVEKADRDGARGWLEVAQTLNRQTERPYQRHPLAPLEWQPPVHAAVFKKNEIVGYHRHNDEIHSLEEEIQRIS